MRKNPTTGKRDTPLAETLPAIPCGLVAKSFFNDTFGLYQEMNDGTKTYVDIREDGIAWSSDINYKFKNIENPPAPKEWLDVQWHDMTDGK